MTEDRRLRILGRLLDGGSTASPVMTLCEGAALVTGLSGAGVLLMSLDRPQGSLCTSDPVSDHLEVLQFDLGEGPGVDAHHSGRPVLDGDLDRADRWPAFAPAAVAAGAHAVFAFPLRVGATRLGALDLHRDEPGDLTADQHADALILADITARSILLHQSEARGSILADALAAGPGLKVVVHQASGMVAAQLEVSVDDALTRLRGHAFAAEVDLEDIARAVVDRSLRFQPDADGFGPTR